MNDKIFTVRNYELFPIIRFLIKGTDKKGNQQDYLN